MSDSRFNRIAIVAALVIAVGFLAFSYWNAGQQRDFEHSERFMDRTMGRR